VYDEVDPIEFGEIGRYLMEKINEKKRKVSLTNEIELSAGSHILYTYMEEERYLENALSFISEGIDKKQVVLYSDNGERLDQIKLSLQSKGYSDDQIQKVIFININHYYKSEDGFHISEVFDSFNDLLTPYLDEHKTIRTWGMIDWEQQSDSTFLPQLRIHESKCDCLINGPKNIITVCAYDITQWSAVILTELLKTHEYHMTDETLTPSHLYHKKSVIFPSISEQLKLEKAAHGQLLQSEKMSIAGQLAAGIAHEIRNPITAIKGFLKLLMNENKDTRYLRIINDEVEKIELIASEFLVLAKPHIEEKQEVNIYQLMRSVKTLLDTQALGKNIGIVFEQDATTVELMVTCDEVKIRQVLINLIKNAIEVMENGYITLSVKEMGDQIHISVTDEGRGMPKEIMESIGQPFFTTKQTGTGLGLYVCQKIIQNHNGQLDVESEEGIGTTFTISLPK
jgi:nitrogen-specific signal transduction histidine kinase